jgi:hypothetical protein
MNDQQVENPKLIIQKRGIWGGYTIERVGNGRRGYYWIGKGDEYLIPRIRP